MRRCHNRFTYVSEFIWLIWFQIYRSQLGSLLPEIHRENIFTSPISGVKIRTWINLNLMRFSQFMPNLLIFSEFRISNFTPRVLSIIRKVLSWTSTFRNSIPNKSWLMLRTNFSFDFPSHLKNFFWNTFILF